MADMVNHPAHYNMGKREVIEEMRILFGDDAVMDFCRLSSYKYIRRADHKGNKVQDLQKADWYIDYLDEMHKEREARWRTPIADTDAAYESPEIKELAEIKALLIEISQSLNCDQCFCTLEETDNSCDRLDWDRCEHASHIELNPDGATITFESDEELKSETSETNSSNVL